MKVKEFVDKRELDDKPFVDDKYCSIPYVKQIDKWNHVYYKVDTEKLHLCCEAMKKVFSTSRNSMWGNCIYFEQHPSEAYRNGPKICIPGDFEIEDGEVCFRDYPIDKCPFCGKNIELYQTKKFREVQTGCETKKVPTYEMKECLKGDE